VGFKAIFPDVRKTGCDGLQLHKVAKPAEGLDREASLTQALHRLIRLINYHIAACWYR